MVQQVEKFTVLIGMDWSDQKHDICLWSSSADNFEFNIIPNKVEDLVAWIQSLHQRFPGQKIAIAVEQKRGPLIYFLMKFDFVILYPIDPAKVATFRKVFKSSRAKDDPTDAKILVELILKHQEKFKPWKPESDEIRALQRMVEFRRVLVEDKIRITNRLTAHLKNYFPQVLDWFEDKGTLIFCDFLTQWPTLEAVQEQSVECLTQFFRSHHSISTKTNHKRIEQIQTAQVLTTDQATVEPLKQMVLALIQQLIPLIESIKTFDRKIDESFSQQEDAHIFRSLPGAGPQMAPRLLVAFGEDRSRYLSAQDLLEYAGIAPVTERSGKQHWVHWRWSCSKFLRQTFVEWAAYSIRYSFWAKAFYEYQKRKGKTHQMAIRALAFKWIRILYRCWKDRVPYDEVKYLMALKTKGSPLVAELST